VRNVLTARIPTTLGKFIRLGAIDPPVVGEKQQPVVSSGGKEVVHHILGSQCGPTHAFTAASLSAIVIGPRALGVSVVGDGDNDIFFWNEVFHRHVAVEGNDRGAALIAVALHNVIEFFAHNFALAGGGVQDGLILGNVLL